MFTRQFYCYLAAVFLTFVGLLAVVGGIWLMAVPDGSGLGLTTALLRDTPFATYFIPGLVLVGAIGVFSLLGAFFTARNHNLSGLVTIGLGLVMIFWMLTQVYWIGLISWLQSLFVAIGLVEMFLGLAIESTGDGKRRLFGKHDDSHAH